MYLINYVINKSADNFLTKIGKESFCVDYYEGILFNESIDVKLSSDLTLFSLGIKYGWFLMEKPPKERVKTFESHLLKLLENFESVYRVDESLIEAYSIEFLNNEYWYREKGAFEKFSKWIEMQEQLHWKKITTDNRG